MSDWETYDVCLHEGVDLCGMGECADMIPCPSVDCCGVCWRETCPKIELPEELFEI